MLDETINLDEIVPVSFISHFHAATGRPRRHLLYPMLKALLLQLIFSIPTTSLLIIFLKFSQELRDFCGFDVIPDASKFTRFKQDFLLDLKAMLDQMVDLTEPICRKIDKEKASMLLFDTFSIKAWVMENNPKYANRIIRQLKAFKKTKRLGVSYTPYKAAYGSMPSHAASNPAIQQMYINGHFCYAFKFGIVTNGRGILRDINFYNKDFLDAHPNIVVGKNPISRMRISALPIPKHSFLSSGTSSESIRLSILRLFWVTSPSIPLKFINISYRKLPLRKLASTEQ